jgi:hypothetical protein
MERGLQLASKFTDERPRPGSSTGLLTADQAPLTTRDPSLPNLLSGRPAADGSPVAGGVVIGRYAGDIPAGETYCQIPESDESQAHRE